MFQIWFGFLKVKPTSYLAVNVELEETKKVGMDRELSQSVGLPGLSVNHIMVTIKQPTLVNTPNTAAKMKPTLYILPAGASFGRVSWR